MNPIQYLTATFLGLVVSSSAWAETYTTVTPDENGDLTFEGDTTLRCEGLTVEGDITVNNGALTLEGGVPTLSYDNFLAVYNDGANHLFYPSTPGNGVKLLENVKLDDIDFFTGRFGGVWSGSDLTLLAVGRLFDRTSESALLQFTVLENRRIKWMNYELRQVGSDIYVKGYKWAKYNDLASSAVAMRAMHQRQEVFPDDQDTGCLTAIAKNDGHYGVARVSAILKNGPSYTVKGNVTASSISLSNATLRVHAALNGTKTFNTPIVGFGSVKYTGASEIVKLEGVVNGTARTVATAAKFTDFIPVAGKVTGGSVNNRPRVGSVTNVKRTDSSCTFQLVADDYGLNKGVKVELSQSGEDVVAKVTWAKYANSSYWPFGYDLDVKSAGSSVATGATAAGYCAQDVELIRGGAISVGSTAADGNTFIGPTYAENCVVTFNPKAVGVGQSVVVRAGADLRVAHTDGNYAYAGRTICYRVLSGGVLATSGVNDWIFGYTDQVSVEGGDLCFFHTGSSGGRDTYLNYLDLYDGARVQGNGVVRVGFHDNGTITLKGGSASIVCHSIKTMNNTGKRAVFDVAEGASLTVGAKILQDSSYAGLPVVKCGAGSLALVNEEHGNGGRYIVEAGTFSCNNNSTLNQNPLTLAGGKLVLNGVATRETPAELTLAGNATIDLKAEQTIAFADSSAQTWAEGAKLDIVGGLEDGKVKFGSSAAGLTAAQLRAITINGKREPLKLTDDGSLKIQYGFSVLIQ